MAGIADRIEALELRVDRLETWAGPGQVEVLRDGFSGLRADVAAVQKVQGRHSAQLDRLTGDVAELKGDVAVLKSDVAELKADVAELKAGLAALKLAVEQILRRLPETS
jgi:chromosome segregation ATPase